MAFPGSGTRRTSSPSLVAFAALLFLTAPWWLPLALPPLQFTRGWTIAFVAMSLVFFALAWQYARERRTPPAA